MARPSLNAVLSTLKACVISNPDGVDEDRLNSEFRQLMGCNIPWRDYEFKTLQDLIKSSSCLRVVTRDGRRLVVAESASVKHLSAMISTQKKAPAKKRSRFPRHPFFQKKMENYRPPDNRAGGGSGFRSGNSFNKGRYNKKQTHFVETNNNYKPSQHYNNSRPAGESSGSNHSSTSTSPTTDLQRKPIKCAPPTKPQFQQNKSKEKDPSPPKVQVKPLPPTNKTDAPKKTNDNKSKENKIKSPPISMPLPNLCNNQPLINLPKLAPSNPTPVQTSLPTVNLHNFVPDNLVPPKPMKPGSYYRGKARRVGKSKLMSIMDDSQPSEGSLTAKFMNLIRGEEWPDPEYRILPRLGPNKVEVYGCTVRGSYSLDNNETLLTYDYSTIPDEYTGMNASREAVSKKAYEDMSSKIKEARNNVPVTCDIKDMIDRIYQIVSSFPNGLWAYKVENDYRCRHGECLPPKWIDFIVDSDILVAEKLADFSHVIRPTEKINGEGDFSEKGMLLGEMNFPTTETWDVYVTKVLSSTEVWFRFVGPKYSDWLDEVTKEMCEHYRDCSMYVCPSPIVGDVYAYNSIYGTVRVRVLSLDSPSIATVVHIDHGDIEEVLRSHLCILDFNFRTLPPQAIRCQMFGLEEYSSNRLCNAFLMDKVEGMVLVAEIIHKTPPVLIMFDTSLDVPVNLNQEIACSLKNDISNPPSLSQEMMVREGLVTSIWKTGELYLQLPNEGLTHLTSYLCNLPEITSDQYISHPDEVLPDVLYLVYVDGVWLRASVIPPTRPIKNMVELLLIDIGDIKTIVFTDLVPLSLISMVLCEIPRQAVCVRLSGVNIFEETAEKLQSLIHPPCKIVAKLISLNPTPEVELFVRESRGLISINSTLLFEEHISENVHRISIEPPSSNVTTIKPALTPDCEEYFDVYVVSVSNPFNFTVIPLKFIKGVTELQDRLQRHYNAVDPFICRLRNFDIGQACAVKHSDGQWYRGLIEQIINRSMNQLMIRFCDFGNIAMISADRLLTLEKKFQDLPALEFSASISGIRPISGDWNIDDCIRVQKLMLEKNLVTVIKEKEMNKGRLFLKLQVIDTTDDKDCDIGRLLVDESRAEYLY